MDRFVCLKKNRSRLADMLRPNRIEIKMKHTMRKNGIIALALLLALFASGFTSTRRAVASPTPPPQITSSQLSIEIQGPFLIQRKGYSVCYDGRTRNPIWVYERLSAEDLIGEAIRCNQFQEDLDVPPWVCSTNRDYRHSGYDRGHLAAAGNHKKDQVAMDETFFLTNISPQTGILFNRPGGAWHALETRIRAWIRQGYTVHVISGPLYLPVEHPQGKRGVTYSVIGPNDVAVPTHFFKVIFIEQHGNVKTTAYLFPNRAIEAQTLHQYETSLEQVQSVSGCTAPN